MQNRDDLGPRLTAKQVAARLRIDEKTVRRYYRKFASILASKNVPLVEIQKMLRHVSIQTTARYIHSLQDGRGEALAALPGLDQEQEQKRGIM